MVVLSLIFIMNSNFEKLFSGDRNNCVKYSQQNSIKNPYHLRTTIFPTRPYKIKVVNWFCYFSWQYNYFQMAKKLSSNCFWMKTVHTPFFVCVSFGCPMPGVAQAHRLAGLTLWPALTSWPASFLMLNTCTKGQY